MGFMMVITSCAGCKKLGLRKRICVNGDHEPAIPIDGRDKAVCRLCFDFYNEGRLSRGLEPVPLHPKAYLKIPEGGIQ